MSVPQNDLYQRVYQDSNQIYEEIRVKWAKVIKHVEIPLKPPKGEAARAYQAYVNAISPNMPIVVLGADGMRNNMELICNVGTLATDPQTNAQNVKKSLKPAYPLIKGKALNELVSNHLCQGAIVNDSNWWIFRNDMFMLGAIHAGKEFHLCYTGIAGSEKGIPSESILWDKTNKRARALGREILMLAAAGYKPITSSKLGLCFIPPAINNAYTYTQITDKIDACSKENLHNYLKGAAHFQITPPPSVQPSPAPLTATSSKSSSVSPSSPTYRSSSPSSSSATKLYKVEVNFSESSVEEPAGIADIWF